MRTVEVVISKDGTIVIDVDGIQGPACDSVTDALVRDLSAEVISDDKKPEYYAQESVTDSF